jgi:hypothetical protein
MPSNPMQSDLNGRFGAFIPVGFEPESRPSTPCEKCQSSFSPTATSSVFLAHQPILHEQHNRLLARAHTLVVNANRLMGIGGVADVLLAHSGKRN